MARVLPRGQARTGKPAGKKRDKNGQTTGRTLGPAHWQAGPTAEPRHWLGHSRQQTRPSLLKPSERQHSLGHPSGHIIRQVSISHLLSRLSISISIFISISSQAVGSARLCIWLGCACNLAAVPLRCPARILPQLLFSAHFCRATVASQMQDHRHPLANV